LIDHVSIGVRDLTRSTALYTAALAPLGHVPMIVRESTVGFGKKYPELWLNHRPGLAGPADSGMHVCLRASSIEVVQTFYEAAMAAGARGDGKPGLRPEYHAQYYAAFVRDLDENLIEVVTFVPAADGAGNTPA
jgi:catechol 2,3-dioxygenase-like lactoylglutathione lyase family enzyme